IGGQDGLEAPRAIPLPAGVRFGYDLAWAPNGQSIAFVDQKWRVWVVDVAAGSATQADADRFAAPDRTIQPAWSPDSKWLAYAKRLTTHFHSVMVYSLAEKKVYQVTDGLSDAISPAWDASGKYLYFLASTDLSLASGWLDMSSYERHVRRGVYVAVLRADLPSPFLPESDEETAARDSTADSTAAAPAKGKTKDAKPPEPAPVRIDWTGLSQRILALDLPLRDYSSLDAAASGVVFIAENAENQTGATLQRYDLKKRKAEVFLSGVQQFSLSPDGKKLLYQTAPGWAVVGTEQTPKPGDGKLTLALPMRLDPRAEWRQIYKEAWRIERDFLYVDNLHGADWDAVYKRYEPWVESVGHRADLTYILDVLGGELSLAHTFTGGGDEPSAADSVKIGQLGVDFAPDGVRYRITRVFTGENWNPDLRAPLSAPGVKAAAGNYLLAINGVELRVPTDPFSLLEGTAGKQTVLRLNTRPTLEGSWTVTVVPVESEAGLRTRAWVEDNRRKVDSLSGGKLAYVWLPNTAEDGYVYFNRYYFSQQDREGAVIDERFNGGGSIADYFVQIMSRKLQGYFNNPIGDHAPFYTPQAGILGPKVMIVNELAGSGGDMLPYLFRQMAIGPLVGTRTWGGLVGIWGAPPLVDGGGITAPRGGFYNLKGEWDVENVGVTPDIEVEQTPRELNAGHDPQLERAVAEAMKLLKTEGVKLLPEPPPPVRVKRPPR
ncbi:MAG TPA: PDZ domain-containing protein, partial [Gemmatimonadales bacterium]|nr:PDZ domain-containing protein [Gemmatimonadales bacterium]